MNSGSRPCGGVHVIVDFWGAEHLANTEKVKEVLREAVTACGADLLGLDVHEFPSTGGVTGVAVLRESHISIHTWPEAGYAAADVFVCGLTDPYKAVHVLKARLKPDRERIHEIRRGLRNE